MHAVAAGPILRRTRIASGLTQSELAARLDVTQPTVAKLESSQANPRISTLERALLATGRRLVLGVEPIEPASVDETMLIENLSLTPAERLERFAGAYRGVRRLAPSVRSTGG